MNFDLLRKHLSRELIRETNAGKQWLISDTHTQAHTHGCVCITLHCAGIVCLCSPPSESTKICSCELSWSLEWIKKRGNNSRNCTCKWVDSSRGFRKYLQPMGQCFLPPLSPERRENAAPSNESGNSKRHPGRQRLGRRRCRPNLLRYTLCPGGPGSGVIASATR